MAPSHQSPARPAEERSNKAFQAVLAEMMALPDAEVTQVNIDPETATATVMSVLPALEALRPQIQKELPLFNLTRLDKLGEYALAVRHADQLYRGVRAPNVPTAQRGAELVALRDHLLRAARLLADHGLLDASRLDGCRRVHGYRVAAEDILTIVAAFQAHWAAIENKTPITRAALAEATSRAADLLSVVSLKSQAGAVARDAAERRAEGDAEVIAPSPYRGRGAEAEEGGAS